VLLGNNLYSVGRGLSEKEAAKENGRFGLAYFLPNYNKLQYCRGFHHLRPAEWNPLIGFAGGSTAGSPAWQSCTAIGLIQTAP
jgi:hypothetical protein